jgi:hypothetical protein
MPENSKNDSELGPLCISALDSREHIAKSLRQAGLGFLLPPEKQNSEAAKVDLNDPLSSLNEAERKEMEADPKLKRVFLDRVEKAEAAVRAEQEIRNNREAAWAAADARDRATAAADRVVAERAKARGDEFR